MKSSSWTRTRTLTTILCRQWVHHSRCRGLGIGDIRSTYAHFHTHSAHLQAVERPTFRSLGIRPPIAASLHAAFPNIKFPTESQAKFIPAVMSGSDVLLKDDTGTGKSFGLIIALLNNPRARLLDPGSGRALPRPCITSLVIVPHRDLAYQLLHWISRMTAATIAYSPPPLPTICQILVRDSTTLLSSRISALREEPPHILIGTPQALLDVWNMDRSALQLESLSTVVVDEVDYLIESVARKPSQKMMEKARKKIDRHPSATRQLLDAIYASRVSGDHSVDTGSKRNPPASRLPQLIMSSATLRNHLKIYLFNESGWLRKEKLQKVVGSGNDRQRGSFTAVGLGEGTLNANQDGLGGKGISHHVLVVSASGNITNIQGATHAEAPENSEEIISTDGGQAITPATLFYAPEPSDVPAIDEKLTEKFANTTSPFNPDMLEAVATAFALDVPSIALLVLPASAPVQRAVYELRGMGVNAHGLDLTADDNGRAHLLNGGAEAVQENPTLLVSTLATTRGLDLPELTHVFIFGILEGRAVDGRTLDSYLHLAGRVGRFGRDGKVITVLEKTADVEGRGENVAPRKDEVLRMRKVLRELQIVPRHFEHFD